jgi:uncharacterized membrane protein YjgN (DUF898 family)
MADGILKISPTGPAVPALNDLSSRPAAADPDYAIAAGSDLGTLVWRGNFLTIVTLGIYRFWYKTDLRRWYWRNTLVGGQGFEYRGTAREKFIGFLFALAVVLPLYFAGALVGLFASEQLGNIITSISLLIIAFLVQYGAYRSRRYRLTRTVWRGLRFDQVGSAWIYALKSAGWGLITLMTLGFGFPLMRRALEAYRINNTRFGSAEGSFSVSATPLMLRWMPLWAILLLIVSVGFYQWSQIKFTRLGDIGLALNLIIAMPLTLGLWVFALWPWYRANEFRLFAKGTSIGPVTFTSGFRTGVYYKLLLKFGGLMFLMLVLSVVVLSLVVPVITRNAPTAYAQIILYGIGVVAYLAVFFLFSCLKELIFNQGFWRHATETMTVSNLAAVDTILGSAVADEAATGEGLADALDFGGV